MVTGVWVAACLRRQDHFVEMIGPVPLQDRVKARRGAPLFVPQDNSPTCTREETIASRYTRAGGAAWESERRARLCQHLPTLWQTGDRQIILREVKRELPDPLCAGEPLPTYTRHEEEAGHKEEAACLQCLRAQGNQAEDVTMTTLGARSKSLVRCATMSRKKK